MSTPAEDEIKDLREKNNELVQKVQFWKMTAAQKENEKLALMKELNELRLKLSRIRSRGAAEARKLDAALQSASEEALSHLVQASEAVARTIELAKTYMRDRQEVDNDNPRWSNLSGNSSTERVHRVAPMNLGGQSIQPVVSLSRAILNTSNPRVASRSPNQNRNITNRAVPMYMLQDVFIPLTRIDVNDLPGNNNVETDEANNIEDSTEDLGLEDISNENILEESQNITEEDFEVSRRLDAVSEDLEPEDEVPTPPPARSRNENPLEGPSWLLDAPTNIKPTTPGGLALEPDSTTELEESARVSPTAESPTVDDAQKESVPVATTVCEFSPTVRRRKRTASAASPPPTPHQYSPPPRARRPSSSGRVLKVVVAKIQLEGLSPGGRGGEGGEGDASSPKRPSLETPQREKYMRFDAPSPNGATDAGVIVSEAIEQNAKSRSRRRKRGGGDGDADADPRDADGVSRDDSTDSVTSRSDSVASRDSDHQRQGRSRRPRKPVTYKEKSLNCKLRR